MDVVMNVAEFAAKTGLIVFAVAVVAILVAMLVARAKAPRDTVVIDDLNHRLRDFETALNHHVLSPKALKAFIKKLKKQKPAKTDDEKKRMYVLSFDGDVKASGVDRLREEITAVLTIARPGKDEVVVKVESPGGMVHSYGLAAAQLLRIRDRGIALTICVDKMAASGGYLMACTGSRILAAPFAIVGSIGVLAQVPNFHKLLKKNNIDYEEITAGEFKRTISVLGEITEKGRHKFQEKIESTHTLFKDFVSTYRPKLQIEKVATGDYWYGRQAIELGLVDELMSSDDYIFHAREEAKIYRIEIQAKKKLADRLAESFGTAVEGAITKGIDYLFVSQRERFLRYRLPFFAPPCGAKKAGRRYLFLFHRQAARCPAHVPVLGAVENLPGQIPASLPRAAKTIRMAQTPRPHLLDFAAGLVDENRRRRT